MAGQGRLRQRLDRLRGHRTAPTLLCALLVGWFAASNSVALADISDEQTDVHLRWQWQHNEARHWKVQLTVIDPEPGASISEIENHSRSDRTTAAFELSEDARTFTFEPRHAVQGGAVQFRLRSSGKAKLSIELLDAKDAGTLAASAAEETDAEREISVSDLLQQNTVVSEQVNFDGKPAWELTRVDRDELRIEGLRSIPIYQPGDALTFKLRSSALVQYASRSLVLQYSLYRVGDGETVSSRRWPIAIGTTGNSEPIDVEESAPEYPGVYEIRCEIGIDDQNIWSRLRRQDPPIARVGRPFVVLPKQDKDGDGDVKESWENVGEIRPSESSWSVGQWLPKQTTRFIPTSATQPLTRPPGTDLENAEHAGESISVLPPDKTFQATLPVSKPGFPHQVTIRYPATRTMNVRVDIAAAEDRDDPAVSFVLASDPTTVGSGKWKTHTFVHYPASDDQIWLTNLDSSSPAAFESIAVRSGPDHLWSGSETRHQSTRKTVDEEGVPGFAQEPPREAVLRLFDIDWVASLTSDLRNLQSLAQCDPTTVALSKLWVAHDRLRDYARSQGMTGVMVPANSGGLTCFESDEFFALHAPGARSTYDLATLLRMFDESGLDIYVGLKPSMLLSAPEREIRRQSSSSTAITRGPDRSSEQYDLLHPLIQESLASLVGDLDRQCIDHRCFAGIAIQCDAESHLQPPTDPDRDAGILAAFARSDVSDRGGSGNEAERNGELKRWLGQQMRRAYAQVGRSSTKPVIIVLPPRSTSRDVDDQPHHHLMAEMSKDANIVFAESLSNGPSHVLSNKALLQQQLAMVTSSMPANDGSSFGSPRLVVLGDEGSYNGSAPTIPKEDVVADVSRVIDEMDPATLIVVSPTKALPLRDDLSSVVRAFKEMPSEIMPRVAPTDPASQTIHVRQGTRNGCAYVFMTSLVTWTSEVEFTTDVAVDWERLEEESDPADNALVENRGTRALVVVPPGRMIVIKSKEPVDDARIKTWSSRVGGGPEALETIKRDVTLIVERIGTLSNFPSHEGLANGGFEQSGGMGLVGWLHAQHPPGCVRIDDKECVEGKKSVLLTTDPSAATRTWIVSEMLEPPRTGRLAVSLACRAELKAGDSNHRLRVSIEATRDQEPVRFVKEFDVPRNGQWRPREVVLEADGIGGTNIGSLRLTVDSLSGGRVWIDDIQLHDHFPTAKEHADLQGQVFRAVQGLQRGNLTPSGRLLQNHWARHLLTLSPPPPVKRVTKTVDPVEQAPGIADRIRSWLPRPLRF